MRPYLVISPADSGPPRRLAFAAIAQLFAEEDVQDEPVHPPSFRARAADAWRNAVAPVREIALLLAEEHRAHQLEVRHARRYASKAAGTMAW
jgi:hypothetical protein